MLSCKQASQLISQSLDRRLSLRERVSVRMHLAICDMCRRFTRQLHSIRLHIRASIRQVESDGHIQLPQEAKKRIADILHTHQQ
jgi:predicted anti-sigma-YlaC factor YlaD